MKQCTASVVRVLTLIVLFGAVPLSGVVRAQEPGAGQIKVLIDTLRYEGKDTYSLIVSTSTRWSKDVLIRIIEEGFFIQTDRGWARLTVNGKNGENQAFILARTGNNDRSASVNIPLSVPDLFRTYEGDLSLMYKYTYSVRTMDGTGVAFQSADEVYCWVKPGTSQWILREGM